MKVMKPFLLMVFTFGLTHVSSVSCVRASDQNRPNIVVIMADDLGLGDVSHHVRTQQKKEPVFETPAMDALARQSLWFTDGHSATSLCSPTRYCMMSGNNNYRSNAPWGVWGTFRATAFVKGEATLGTVVQDAGYATGFVGKWHLGGDFRDLKSGGIYRGTKRGTDLSDAVDLSRCLGGGPSSWGFDYDFTLPCGIQGPYYTAYENDDWYPLGTGMGDSAWDAREMGKLLSSKAVDFIESHANKEKPFFLYYCSPMCHLPHCPPDEFDGKKIKGATPSLHLDMVLDLDQQINRIVEGLKTSGQYDNTLILLTSDNGGLSVDKATLASGHDVSGGFSGSKNSPLEGGHRTPFFAVWKGHIKPGVTHEPALNQDFVATLAALVGTSIPDDQARDSNNLLPLLTGEGEFQQRAIVVQQAGSQKELIYRKGPWKLIIQADTKQTTFEPIALFNLNENPKEKQNQNFVNSVEHKSRVKKMRDQYVEMFRSGVRTAPKTPPSN